MKEMVMGAKDGTLDSIIGKVLFKDVIFELRRE